MHVDFLLRLLASLAELSEAEGRVKNAFWSWSFLILFFVDVLFIYCLVVKILYSFTVRLVNVNVTVVCLLTCSFVGVLSCINVICKCRRSPVGCDKRCRRVKIPAGEISVLIRDYV